ncbi:hypothetical protein SAMN02745883_00611 [Caminicella sporogenes DSM 14501]|uniref:GrdX protein n=1 Tax=Caminicella sporogenes DSM 14501 TaxID=1121266 RepID=A0A1M6MS56_9FIRM|nr:GrdX family protein [Caminicella sporogenes]RKD22526.1 GrdX protein [Caminicella sporogenes]WIF94939.1 GrdX family protein [Caminicella sporogenes]SHJ86297.1 hypothetical protein SAMN02745883_00611 [Caminicella sporogenes DSM 14501]
MKKIIVTNNRLVCEKFHKNVDIIFNEDFSYLDVLKCVRDKIHEGHKLLTHPLSGSVKPNETPFKSVVISFDKGNMDFDSLAIIEESIIAAEKFINQKKLPKYSERVLDDCRFIDYCLIRSGIDSIDQFY